MENNILNTALKNPKFKATYDYGIKTGLILHFDDLFIESMKDIYIDSIDCSLYDYFKRGDNIGFCLQACNYISEMFSEFEIYKGLLPAISGTRRSPNGEHAWLISEGTIYDTSLLLQIDESLSEQLGYNPQGLINKKTNTKRNFNNL